MAIQPMNRNAALAAATRMVTAGGGTITRLAAKLMTYDAYLRIMEPGFHFVGAAPAPSPGTSYSSPLPTPYATVPLAVVANMAVHSNDPVWVVAAAGVGIGGASDFDLAFTGRGARSGVVVYNAKTGEAVEVSQFPNSWPPGFDSLPSYATLPCVPA
jgi:hypothetical protein